MFFFLFQNHSFTLFIELNILHSRSLTFKFPLSRKKLYCNRNFSKLSNDSDQASAKAHCMLSLDLWKDYLQSLISPYYFKYSNTQTSYRWSHYRTLVDRSSGPFRYDRSWCFRRPTPHRPPPHSPVHPPPSLGAPLHHRCPPGSSLGLGPRAVPPPSDGIEAEKFLLCVLLRL